MADRRSHRRIPFLREVKLKRHNGQPCALLAEDISLAGMRLYSERPFNVGEILELQFDVRPRGKPHHLDLRARVQHVELEREGYRVGVGFLDTD
jgi:hypothetical protein